MPTGIKASCTKSHPLGCASYPAKDATSVVKKPPKEGKGRGQKIDNVGTDDYHLNEVEITSVSQYHQSE